MKSMKRNLRLFGGAGTILLSVFMLISALAVIALVSGQTGLTFAQRATVNRVIGISVALAVLSVVAATVAVVLCLDKRPRTMAVILAVIMSVMSVLEFAASVQRGRVNALGIVYGILCLIAAGILVAYMFAKGEQSRAHSIGHSSRFDGRKHAASEAFESAEADDFTATEDNDFNDDLDDII